MKKNNYSTVNGWMITGFILIILSLFLFFISLNGGSSRGSSSSSDAMGFALFGGLISQIMSWPIYLFIAGFISCGVGYLSAIHDRLKEISYMTERQIVKQEIQESQGQ